MQEEREYLKKVINSINNQISNYEIDIAKQTQEKNLTRDQLSANFDDMDNEEVSRHKVDVDEADKVLEIMKKDQKRLERQVNRPYFARIDFKSQEGLDKVYIGLGHIQNNGERLVYDWRAPVSSIYYDFDGKDAFYECEDGKIEGQVILKRQFNIENQKLNYFIDAHLAINDEILQEVLSKNTSSKMKEIVSTIQKDQNKLIRSDENKSLIVQGVAGSGKTSVALHRTAYLLYKNKNYTSKDIFILSPSNLFSNYISNVLPELGEENVIEATFLNLAKAELNTKIQTRDVFIDELCQNKTKKKLSAVAYKSSFEYLDELLEFLSKTYINTFRATELVFGTKEKPRMFVFTKKEMEDLYYSTYSNLPVYKRIAYMSEYLIERFNLRKNEFKPIKERFMKMLYNFFPTVDPCRILNLFLSVKGFEENEPDVCYYDNIAGLLIIKDFLFDLDMKTPAKYIIIDEMQDFTPAHFYLLNKIWDCPKLVLGDIHQCIEKQLSDEYLKTLSAFLGADVITLNKSYRSTKEISEFSQKIIGLKNVENMARSGEKPEVIKTENQVSEIANLVNKNINHFKHIAIICKTSKEVNNLYESLKNKLPIHKISDLDSSFDHKLIITTSTTSKGIEFDYVIIPNADEKNYSDQLDRNLLYISTTRALHKLSLLYEGRKSKFLK